MYVCHLSMYKTLQYCRLESGARRPCLWYKPACVQCQVTLLLTAYTSRSGEHMKPCYFEDTDSYNVASFPGHSQILFRSRGEKSIFLHRCEIKSGSGLGTRLAIMRSSISRPLCIFSARFAIEKSTFCADNFQAHLHWWGTASCC